MSAEVSGSRGRVGHRFIENRPDVVIVDHREPVMDESWFSHPQSLLGVPNEKKTSLRCDDTRSEEPDQSSQHPPIGLSLTMSSRKVEEDKKTFVACLVVESSGIKVFQGAHTRGLL